MNTAHRPVPTTAQLGPALNAVGPVTLASSYDLCVLSLLVTQPFGCTGPKESEFALRSDFEKRLAHGDALRCIRRLQEAGLVSASAAEDPAFVAAAQRLRMAWWPTPEARTGFGEGFDEEPISA